MKKPTTKSKEMRSEYRDWLQHRLRARVVEAIELDSVYCDRILGCKHRLFQKGRVLAQDAIRRLDITDHGTFGPASAILHIASKSRMVSNEFFSVPKRAISPWRIP